MTWANAATGDRGGFGVPNALDTLAGSVPACVVQRIHDHPTTVHVKFCHGFDDAIDQPLLVRVVNARPTM